MENNEHPVWDANDEIEYYFERLGEAIGPCSESRLKLYINGLLVALTERLEQHRPQLDESLSSPQRAVELFLTSLPRVVDQPWDLTSMAAACGLQRSRFSHYCKQITNMTPIEYLTRCRVEEAARLMTVQRKLSFTDVAMRCGFESAQYFSRVFHEQMGSSHRDYRRLQSRENTVSQCGA
jgi:transcriptional regulator GlxA family with amidase domain